MSSILYTLWVAYYIHYEYLLVPYYTLLVFDICWYMLIYALRRHAQKKSGHLHLHPIHPPKSSPSRWCTHPIRSLRPTGPPPSPIPARRPERGSRSSMSEIHQWNAEKKTQMGHLVTPPIFFNKISLVFMDVLGIYIYIYDSASTSLRFCDPARWACCPRLFWNLNLDIKIPQGISCAISAHPRHSSAHPPPGRRWRGGGGDRDYLGQETAPTKMQMLQLQQYPTSRSNDSASTSLRFCDPARWACCPRLFWNLNLDIKIPQGISCAISAHPRHSSAHPLATKCSGSQTRKAGAQGKWIGLCSKRPEDSGCVTACQGPMLPTSAWAHMLLSSASDS